MVKYLAIDIGGTLIKYSVMDAGYRVYEEGSLSTEKEPADFLGQITDIAGRYREAVAGYAICMAGFINPATGENSDFSIGANFRTYNIKTILEEKFQLPVVLENDSNCAALGEMVSGAARGCQDFCMLTFGTGIGGALVLGGELYRGRNFKAGEAGFTRIGLSGSGEHLCAEAAGATSVLVKRVSDELGFCVDGKYIFERLDSAEINRIYSEWLYKGAMVTGNIAVTLDPERVLIGGGISENKRFIEDLSRAVYELYPHLEDYTEIRACEQGNMAGRIGALYLLIRNLK